MMSRRPTAPEEYFASEIATLYGPDAEYPPIVFGDCPKVNVNMITDLSNSVQLVLGNRQTREGKELRDAEVKNLATKSIRLVNNILNFAGLVPRPNITAGINTDMFGLKITLTKGEGKIPNFIYDFSESNQAPASIYRLEPPFVWRPENDMSYAQPRGVVEAVQHVLDMLNLVVIDPELT